MTLSVSQEQQLNTYLRNNPRVSREQAIEQLFGGATHVAGGTAQTLFKPVGGGAFSAETEVSQGASIFSNNKVQDTSVMGFVKSVPDAAEKNNTPASESHVSVSAGEIETVEYTQEEIENISVQTLSEDVANARKLYNAQNEEQGGVSKFVNATKENFDTEFASSRVGRQIRKEELCTDLLERSKSPAGLSEKEYLESKIDFVMSLIQDLEQYSLRTEVTRDAVNISLKALTFGIVDGDKGTKNSQELKSKEAELDYLKSMLERLSPEEINSIISSLISVDENPQGQSECNISLGGKANQLVKKGDGLETTRYELDLTPSNGSLASLSKIESYRKMSFEETFQKERWVEYDPDAIMDYTKKDSYTQFLLGIHNRREQVYDLLKDAKFIKQTRAYGSEQMPGEIQNNASRLMSNLNTVLKTVYGNDAAKIQDFVESSYSRFGFGKKPELIINDNGEFERLDFGLEFEGEKTTLSGKDGKDVIVNLSNLNMKIDDLTINSMINLAEKLQSNIDNTYNQALNGKTIEEYGEEVKQAYAKAYGSSDVQDIANSYIQSQQEGVGYIKTGVSTLGMAVMVAGQLIPVAGQTALVWGGMALSTLGGVGTSAIENYTKDGGPTQQDKEEMIKELGISLAMVGSGMVAGKLGEMAHTAALLKNCPKVLAYMSEVGVDAATSVLADYAITGQVDLSSEGIAQLQGLLVGLARVKFNPKKFFDTHAGEVKPSTSSNEIRQQETSAVPRGLNAEDDALIQRARTENPAETIADKVRDEWQRADINTGVKEEPLDLFNLDPMTGLREAATEVNGEVTSLIIKGKLNDALTKRYDEMGNVFKDIAQKRSADIKQLAQQFPNDKQAFANGVVKILAEEFGMKGLEPKIELRNISGADGQADWTTGTIRITNSESNAKKLVEIISHEFVHMLQYRDILAQYGEQGLKEVVMNDKEIPANKKEATLKEILESPYTKNLLENFDLLKASETGSLNEYITRIYKDEFANVVSPDKDMAGYVNQTTEREAYNLGSEQLGNRTNKLDDITVGPDVPNDNSLAAMRARLRQKLRNGENIEGQKLDDSPVKNSDYTINESGEVHFNGPKGILSSNNDVAARELCRNSDGTINKKAVDLYNAIKNSNEYKNSQSSSALDEFERLLKSCQIDGKIDENLLSYAQRLCEISANKLDNNLAIGKIIDVKDIIYDMSSTSAATREQIFNAAQELYSMPNCRDSVVDMMLSSCLEKSSGVKTFNANAFNKIKDLLKNKPEHHNYTQDYSYSLRVAEIAKSSVIEKRDANGNYVKQFDEVSFELAKAYDASNSSIVHIAFNDQRSRNVDGKFELSDLGQRTQQNIARVLTKSLEARQKKNFDLELNNILDECRDNPTKLFAAKYMLENLDFDCYDTYQLVKEFRSAETVISDLQKLSANLNTVRSLNLYDRTGTNIILTELLKSGLDAKDVLPILKNKEIFNKNYGSLETILAVVNVSKGKYVPFYSEQPDFLLHRINNYILPDKNIVKALSDSGIDVVKMQADALNRAEYHLPEVNTPNNKSSFLNDVLSTSQTAETRLKSPTESGNILTSIEAGIPEFAQLPNKQQTVTLLQNIMNNPEYAKLDNLSKTILKYSVILKDIPLENQKAILKQYNVPDNLCKRIETISKPYGDPQVKAGYLQNGNDFDVYKLFQTEQAKLNPEVKHVDLDAIETNINKARENTNLLYPSQIVNQNLIPERTFQVGGQTVRVKVLDFSDPNLSNDLQHYGFEPGTTKENLRLITHMFNTGTGSETSKIISAMNAVIDPSSEGITLSATYRPVGQNETFGDGFGIVIAGNEVTSVPMALNSGFHSGLRKTDRTYINWLFSDLKVDPDKPMYYEENMQAKARTFLKENLLEALKNNGFELDDREYALLTRTLANHKYLSNMPPVKIGDKIIPSDVLSATIRESQDKLLDGNSTFNEVLVNNPKIQAIITNQDLKYLSPSLIVYAQQHNLPIIKVK